MRNANEEQCSLRELRGYKKTLESLIQDTASLAAQFISFGRMASGSYVPVDAARNSECLAMARALCRLVSQELAAVRYEQGMRILEAKVNSTIDGLGCLSERNETGRVCHE